MISVRRGPFRDVFLLFSGLLVGAGIVLYYPDTIGSDVSRGPIQSNPTDTHADSLSIKRMQFAVEPERAKRTVDKSLHNMTLDNERLPVTKVRPKTIAEELILRKTLFIGVVTAERLLSTRGKAIFETWGKSAPMITFFSGEGESRTTLPVVSLPGVDDTYPPQKKVFRMLKYMHDNYINEYNWFLRADDDVYIRVPQLIQFLNTLDSNKMVYMGQPGMGKPQDLERIKLRPDEHYCMGGTGVIYSNTLLKRLAPHLDECLSNVVVSYNEDLEVGRCISRRLNVQCTWSYELSRLFYMDYSKGEIFKSEAVYKDKKLPNALTVHAFKKPAEMYKIHQYFIEVDINKTKLETQKYEKELAKVRKLTKKQRAYGPS